MPFFHIIPVFLLANLVAWFPAFATEIKGDTQNYQILVGGKNVWPPQGPQCDKLVRCCDAAGRKDSSANLFCQLLAAKQPFSCQKDMPSVLSYITERKMEIPLECR